jgi:hypothetical protein
MGARNGQFAGCSELNSRPEFAFVRIPAIAYFSQQGGRSSSYMHDGSRFQGCSCEHGEAVLGDIQDLNIGLFERQGGECLQAPRLAFLIPLADPAVRVAVPF